MYFDDRLTQSMQDWLNTEPARRDFEKGAEMMLKLNHNKILYQNAIRRPDKMMAKVEYELRKFLKMQLDRVTTDQVIVMEKEIIPAAETTLAENAPVIDSDNDNSMPPRVAKGRRDDHDTLPEEIKALWEKNGEVYFKIKELYNTLKTMESAQPCDRYEYLVQLKELDTRYHKNLEIYDSYVAGNPADGADEAQGGENPSADAAEMFKKASAARTYISENKKKLEALKMQYIVFQKDEPKRKELEEEYDKLLSKVQQRYDWLVGNGLNVSDEQLAVLKELGLNVG